MLVIDLDIPINIGVKKKRGTLFTVFQEISKGIAISYNGLPLN